MSYVGAPALPTFQHNARCVPITSACLCARHPHDVVLIKEALNYAGR